MPRDCLDDENLDKEKLASILEEMQKTINKMVKPDRSPTMDIAEVEKTLKIIKAETAKFSRQIEENADIVDLETNEWLTIDKIGTTLSPDHINFEPAFFNDI